MHRTLKTDATKPAAAHVLQQQARTFTVTHCGRICFHGRKISLSHVFAGQHVGVTQVSDHVWLVTFMHYDLGDFDDEAGRVEPIENPFARKCYLCARNNLSPM